MPLALCPKEPAVGAALVPALGAPLRTRDPAVSTPGPGQVAKSQSIHSNRVRLKSATLSPGRNPEASKPAAKFTT